MSQKTEDVVRSTTPRQVVDHDLVPLPGTESVIESLLRAANRGGRS